jgi:hypothetical protein
MDMFNQIFVAGHDFIPYEEVTGFSQTPPTRLLPMAPIYQSAAEMSAKMLAEDGGHPCV